MNGYKIKYYKAHTRVFIYVCIASFRYLCVRHQGLCTYYLCCFSPVLMCAYMTVNLRSYLIMFVVG